MASKREKSIIRSSRNLLLSSIFFLHIFLLCSSHVYCSARDILKHGEWIDSNKGSTLVSPGGMFELEWTSTLSQKNRLITGKVGPQVSS
ncbi:hypothetical protein CFP56_040462 [Quercus suber]|uniref:Uncharacterized protein n=1 Tax=Quercus suber TaxID=58331 RepID=A0AAW0IY52_QUESU